jgi:hypothetical protein
MLVSVCIQPQAERLVLLGSGPNRRPSLTLVSLVFCRTRKRLKNRSWEPGPPLFFIVIDLDGVAVTGASVKAVKEKYMENAGLSPVRSSALGNVVAMLGPSSGVQEK